MIFFQRRFLNHGGTSTWTILRKFHYHIYTNIFFIRRQLGSLRDGKWHPFLLTAIQNWLNAHITLDFLRCISTSDHSWCPQTCFQRWQECSSWHQQQVSEGLCTATATKLLSHHGHAPWHQSRPHPSSPAANQTTLEAVKTLLIEIKRIHECWQKYGYVLHQESVHLGFDDHPGETRMCCGQRTSGHYKPSLDPSFWCFSSPSRLPNHNHPGRNHKKAFNLLQWLKSTRAS